ncbi:MULTISPECIES: ABC transporter permease [unclassified Streptomyces]|uniref:ABC transporter permease n=1 Tax=unclassified Streptomyces TaxID=2593676 RepID=UPI002E131883|nr:MULTISPECIES: ABC transporter permease [unclassified Streptomyces]WSR29173.1 ABC transporter permease [Streptomyces sp. NBC_01205]
MTSHHGPAPASRRSVRTLLQLIGYGALASYQDYRAMFTWRSWLGGWLVRLLCQVLFFANLGALLGSPEQQGYLALGNAVVLGPLGALGVVSSTVGERRSGTLQFLLISRTPPFLALASRGLHWVADGLLTSTVALLAVHLLLPVPLHWAALPAILFVDALMTLGCYCLALCLSGISLRMPESRMYLTAGTTIVLLLVAGVNTSVPHSGALAWVARVLPVSHGLSAVRQLAHDGTLSVALVLHEALILAGWAAIGFLVLTHGLRHTVRSGSLTLR